jgi:hypothetical protein
MVLIVLCSLHKDFVLEPMDDHQPLDSFWVSVWRKDIQIQV